MESSGGGIAAALTLYARDKDEVNIAFQMPLYPMIDDRMITESAKENNAPVWNSNMNEWSWKLYLGELYERMFLIMQHQPELQIITTFPL